MRKFTNIILSTFLLVPPLAFAEPLSQISDFNESKPKESKASPKPYRDHTHVKKSCGSEASLRHLRGEAHERYVAKCEKRNAAIRDRNSEQKQKK